MSKEHLKLKNNFRPKSVRKKTAARISAVQVLYLSLVGNVPLDEAIDLYFVSFENLLLEPLKISNLDMKLFKKIIYGVEKNKIEIDFYVSNNLNKDWKINRLSVNELNIFRLSIFELIFDNSFNKKTIINEYIGIFSVFCGDVNFANGFLDGISNENLKKM